MHTVINYCKRLLAAKGSGATLVELLLYMGLLSIFFVVLTNLFSSAVDIQLESNASSSIDRDANYIFAKLAYDIHRADTVSTPASNGSSTAGLQLVIGGATYSYSVDSNGNIAYATNTGTYILNSYDTRVSNVSFTRVGNLGGTNDTIRVGLRITSLFNTAKGDETRDFQTTIGMRE